MPSLLAEPSRPREMGMDGEVGGRLDCPSRVATIRRNMWVEVVYSHLLSYGPECAEGSSCYSTPIIPLKDIVFDLKRSNL